jgi:hypothetical protein
MREYRVLADALAPRRIQAKILQNTLRAERESMTKMKSLVAKIAFAGVAAIAIQSPSYAIDGMSLEYGTGNSTQLARIGAQFNWGPNWNFWQSNGTHRWLGSVAGELAHEPLQQHQQQRHGRPGPDPGAALPA